MEIKKKPAIELPTSETLSVLDQNEPQNGIEVICRIRPKFVGENYVNYTIIDKRLDIYETNNDNEISNQKTFTFSQIYDQNSTQKNLHQEYVIPMIKDIFEKQKGGLVFTYGVTNSGKTYTIIGNQEAPGILPLTLQTLDKIKTAFLLNKTTIEIDGQVIKIGESPYDDYVLKEVNYTFQSFEIYNEEIYDLLANNKTKLQLKEIYDKKCYVKDAVEKEINTNQQFKDLLQKALTNRQMGETTLNNQSSRSHTIFKIQISFLYQQDQYTIQKKQTICIVDLAGSERTKKAETQGSQLTEACNINKSLLVLGKCLKQMRCQNESEQNNRIPFRECKLTRLLCEYFTEENKILMIVNVRLTGDDIEETLKVLHYGALSVNVNLLKSKIYDNTLSYNQRLQINQSQLVTNDSKQKKVPKRNAKEIIRRAKMLVQNTTQHMLFQQTIQDSFVKDLISTVKQQQARLKQFGGLDDELFYPPTLESDYRLQKSLDKIQSDKSRQASIDILEQDGSIQLSQVNNLQINNQNANFQEEIPQRKSYIYNEPIFYNEQNQEAINNENLQINQLKLSEIQEENQNINSIKEQTFNYYDEQEDLMNGLKQLDLEQIDEQSDDSKQQSKSHFINSNYNQENNINILNKSSNQVIQEHLINCSNQKHQQNHFDQATNTTPYDEMKKKLFGQLFEQELLKHQQEKDKFKQEVMQKLFDDDELQNLIEKENKEELMNLEDSAKKQQQRNIEKLISSNHKSDLKIINESDKEHDSSGEKINQQQKSPPKKKKQTKKKGKSRRR
ncbi:unnamed protein product [Paramecium sonneborni]|uniref:Kinesin motor domain-containing protein n=1 Tax=Paramecium sonneborni TaxID=65129 RepID=A0A8S1LB20_9CILI|nr:unnamed protein product [Paramecium sonneborni]